MQYNQDWYDAFDGRRNKEAKEDVFDVYDQNPKEVTGFLKLLEAGKVDGRLYAGECSCLLGSIAVLKGLLEASHSQKYTTRDVYSIISENVRKTDPNSPAEAWVLRIATGHTPENNPFARELKSWTLEWLEDRGMLK